MLRPSIYGENLFDDFFNGFPFFDDGECREIEKKLYGSKAGRMMSTDVKETDSGYEMKMDLPGFKKEEMKLSLENGYLTVQAEKGFDKLEESKENGHYIRKERYAGSCSRSFYVGEDITEEDIKAEFKHGILKLTLPKKNQEKNIEQKKYIPIEG